MKFGLEKILKAQEVIKPYIEKTSILRLRGLDKYLGCKVYVKTENMQVMGAFKIRGAVNKILSLSEEEIKKGLVAVSSGNHGRAVTYLAKKLGTSATIVMQNEATKSKVDAIRALGAEIILCDSDKRLGIAEKLCKEKGSTMIPPYNDEEIMAGQGTIGLEIIEQFPEVNYVVVPVSGGGLISGVATAIKESKRDIKVYGAEPAVTPRYTRSMEKDEIVKVEPHPSVADALPSQAPGDKCFPFAQKNVDKFFPVEEKYILEATKLLLLEGKLFAETSSAIGMGAVLQGNIKFKPEDKVCFVISGGNASLEQIKLLEGI